MAHHLPRRFFGVGGHGIFEIEYQPIGWQGFGPFEGSGIGARHEKDAAARTDDGWHISLTLALSRKERD